MSLHLSHCREIRPAFESGCLGVHSTWGRKHRIPLTYLLLREGSSWGACGNLAYLFSQRQGIILILRRYGVHGTILKLLYWSWCSCILETVGSGKLWSFLKGVKPLVLYDVDGGMFMSQCKGNWPHFHLIWVTQSYFVFLRWNQCSSCLVKVLLGTLWSSVKQIEAPSLFDWKNPIALHAMQGNRGWSVVEDEISWFLLSYVGDLGYILELQRGCPFETGVGSAKSGHLCTYNGHIRNVN